MSYATACGRRGRRVRPRLILPGYSRDSQFGDWQHNSSLCGYGTSRDYVLKRDMTNVVMNRYCKVESADWREILQMFEIVEVERLDVAEVFDA